MSYDKQAFVSDLERVLSMESSNTNIRWNEFLNILQTYQPLNKHYAQTVHDFDKLHNDLIHLLLNIDENNSPLIDFSQFKRFESLIVHFRQTIESCAIQNTIVSERLAIVQDELDDFKKLIYEKEFKKLSSAISFQLKNVLSKFFRGEHLQIDPLDRSLLDGLLKDYSNEIAISKSNFNIIIDKYKQLSNDMNITNYKDLIKVMNYRRIRNIEEHEFLDDYISDCKSSNIQPNFLDLLSDLNLMALMKYKKSEMEILEKIFTFYFKQTEHR